MSLKTRLQKPASGFVKNTQAVEDDLRKDEFKGMDPDDYEVREDGQVLRKDRFHHAMSVIAGIMGQGDFEILKVVEAIQEMKESHKSNHLRWITEHESMKNLTLTDWEAEFLSNVDIEQPFCAYDIVSSDYSITQIFNKFVKLVDKGYLLELTHKTDTADKYKKFIYNKELIDG